MADEDVAGCKKGLADAAVICELWRLAMTLLLLVFTNRVCKWSIHSSTNQNPVYSHTHIRDNYIALYHRRQQSSVLTMVMSDYDIVG
jgi:hypothetical protein